MLKKICLACAICFYSFSFAQKTATTSWVDYVNPLIGTDSRYDLSNGNTYPSIALPWGMNSWTPQTNTMGNGWAYQYATNTINGFKQTHQPSPWINDYGAFSIFATTNQLVFDEKKRASWFSHKAEIATPYYYKTYLADYNTTVEITPTERAAIFQITYPQTNEAYLLVDAFFKNSFVQIIPEERKIIGYACNNSGGVPNNFKNYFVIYIDKKFDAIWAVDEGKLLSETTSITSKHAGAIVRFKTSAGEKIQLKIASSFISVQQAELNLKTEIGTNDFEAIKAIAKSTWNNMLGRVQVEGGTYNQYATFYTALYRTMLFPRKFYELDEQQLPIHYSPYNGKIEKGYLFTDNGFWDTFRAVFPLFTLVFPDMSSLMMQSLENTYKESGWLPEWASPGHRDCMIGSHSASIISDAYLKGIRGYNIDTLFTAILKNTQSVGPLSSVGRLGATEYNTKGYIPYDIGINENVARTLEYSYDDFTIAQLAKTIHQPQALVDTFLKRAQYYKNVFDPSVNFMRGRNKDGSFQSPFRADKWGDAFTEGCAWHWTWCVFQDVQGLVNMMGGKKAFTQKLDEVFTTAPTFDYSYYGSQIHEITEMLIANMGQYAHGNQPIQHMPYLYNYAGQTWKTQYHVRNIMDRLYTNAPDGLCGDEDNGQTSAWYVFSALGFYPVCPGSNQYVIGTPLFKKASVHFSNGNILHIDAPQNSKENMYIQSLRFNHQIQEANYFTHQDLIKGGNITFDLTSTPNYNRGIEAKFFPFSITNSK